MPSRGVAYSNGVHSRDVGLLQRRALTRRASSNGAPSRDVASRKTILEAGSSFSSKLLPVFSTLVS